MCRLRLRGCEARHKVAETAVWEYLRELLFRSRFRKRFFLASVAVLIKGPQSREHAHFTDVSCTCAPMAACTSIIYHA